MDINVKGTIVSDDVVWIYDLFRIQCVSPQKISDVISKANGEALDVYINSGGGDVFAGSEIYSLLREYKGNVRIHVHGIAASAASVIAMAGQSDISPTAQMMIHNVSSYAEGDYRDMDHTSNVLQTANRSIAAAYVQKTGMSEKDLLKMMDNETWMTAADAVERGFIDKISDAGSSNKNQMLVASYGCTLLPQSIIDEYVTKKNDMMRRFEALKNKEV